MERLDGSGGGGDGAEGADDSNNSERIDAAAPSAAGAAAAAVIVPAHVIAVNVANFGPGLRALEAACAAARGARAGHREVALFHRRENTGEVELQSLRRSYSRFVALLERCGRETGGVRAVRFACLVLNDGVRLNSFDADDHGRLFGEVLPNLPNLERVHFDRCFCFQRRLPAFLSRLSETSSLVELEFSSCYGYVRDCVPAFAAMIRRNVPLQVLKLDFSRMLGEDDCRQIFESLQHNTNLRRLEVKVTKVYADALILPTNRASSLRSLRIDVTFWTDEGKSVLAAQLKTNTVLQDLHIVHGSDRPLAHEPWVEMLESHNYTLRLLQEHPSWTDGPAAHQRDDWVLTLLRRNGRIHEALEQLQGYRVPPTVPWPHLLEMVSGLPTLLYRFVRPGDVNALGDLLAARQRQLQSGGAGDKKKRGHSQPPALRRSVRAAKDRGERSRPAGGGK